VGFNLNGFVLRPARVASGNDPDTNEAVTGVDRDHILANDRSPAVDNEETLESLGYEVRPVGTGVLVEPYADMYRAAVLEKAESKYGDEQYCVFAATTGSLSTIEDDSMAIFGDGSTASPIAGSLDVDGGAYTDGTLSFYIRDGGQRDISDVLSITIIKAPSVPLGPSVEYTFDVFTEEDVSTGKITLGGTAPTDLGGGFSVERGDKVTATVYVLASPTFWWSRNDPDVTRFGWDGKTSRWLPLKGGRAASVGTIIPEGEYKLVPPPSRFETGQTLPGASSAPDAYALVRCGLYADADSTPLDILVVSDDEAAGDVWDAAWAAYNAVVGVSSGVLFLNPSFATGNAGRTLWYNAESFQSDADGDLGPMATLPTGSNQGFPSLSPVPGPTERPFLRIGSRRYMTPIPKDDDAALSAPSGVPSGSFEWSKATGKIVLSDIDIAKCIPGSATVDGDPADYEIPFLGARLYYDGVALSTQPIPLKGAVTAYNSAGHRLNGTSEARGVPADGPIYLPRAVCMPPPGISGVRWEADGTGDVPVVPGPSSLALNEEPQTRPNGTGLVRRIDGSGAARIYGDSFFFSQDYAYENTDVVEYDDDLKDFKFKVPKNEVEAARMVSPTQPFNWTNTSRLQLRRRPVKGKALYFRQAEVIPSTYADEARIFSRLTEPYSIAGTENIRFAIDGTIYFWNAGALNPTGVAADYTAQQVADSLVADAGVDPNAVGVMRGRVFLRASDLTKGSVEIGWNDDTVGYTDLSGHAALGFLPGWRVDLDDGADRFRWLPDNGAYLGVFRSPVNMDRSDDTPDIRAVGRVSDSVLNSSIPAIPSVPISPAPLLDVPGYTDTSHFKVIVGLLTIEMENYKTRLDVGVVYDWVNDRFVWSEEGTTGGTQVPYPTSTLQLDNVGVFPQTVSPLAMDDGTFGLNLRRATDAVGQTLPASFAVPEDLTGEDITIDFLMPGDGGPGQAVLVTPEGEMVATGGKGEANAGSDIFFDQNIADQTDLYDAVEVGYLLHILSGANEGVYTITAKDGSTPTTLLQVVPPFPGEDRSTQWRIYEAKTRDAVDLTLLADVQQRVVNHFPDEPFKVRTLTSTGKVTSPPALNANVADALVSGRLVSLRFGLDPIPANERTVSYLIQGVDLGAVAATGLVCPDLTDPHLTLSSGTDAYFQIRVGADVFSTALANLTLNVGSTTATSIDVDTTTGEILVGSDIVTDLAGSRVYYDQSFLPQADVPAGTCEINPINGDVNITETDNSTYLGEKAYFVEQMVTENSLDVTINPLNGSLLFSKPLRAMQIVEVNYYKADTNGDKALDDDGNPKEITEFLPLMVTLEAATYVSDTEWTYNPTGRTLSETVEPFIWVGTNLMNFAGVGNATAADGVITITDEAQALLETTSATEVQINYGVLEAFGGETAYTVSAPPVYRKPFWIEAESSTFTLETDRTADFSSGLLMILGTTPLYIDAASYDAASDTTTVTIFPTPENEVGSRSPGREAGLTLSDFVVSVSRGGGQGFMPVLDTAVTPLLECDKGQVAVAFYGDVRRYMRTNHLLEIDGYPYLIIDSRMSDDGYNTIVQVSNPLYKAHDNSDVVRVSVRPIYFSPPPVEFKGISPFIPSEEFDLFLMGRTDSDGNLLPGKALVEGLDYTVDPDTGDVIFQAPTQGGLQPGEYLHFRYTRLISVEPTTVDGALLYPVYRGKYLYQTTPTVENRLLGGVLKGEYTYRSQDSFFFMVQTLEGYLGEVSTVSASQGVIPFSGGPTSFNTPSADPAKQGTLGLRGGAVDAQDQDRAARVFIEFFNGVILAFEQVLETIDGRIIGDRDGKFRFFIGHDKRYAPPGYEDEITGDLNERQIWRDIIDTWAPASFESNDGYFRTKDDLYLPTAASVPLPTVRPGETFGPPMDPTLFTLFADKQRRYIKNDMDDRLLIKPRKPRITFNVEFLFPIISFKGDYDGMWENHRFSRLFPTETEHFSRLFPGIEYDPETQYAGFFTPGRDIVMPGPEPGETSEQTVRTFGQPNGVVSNNALGGIPNIIDVSVKDRQGRGRVWAYYPSGSSDLETALGLTPGSTSGKATLVVTVLTLSEFPITEDGWPDIDPTTGLVTGAGNGVVESLLTGNSELATPAFEVGQRVNYGKPDGSTYSLKDGSGNGIFITEVLAGCVVILGTSDGNASPTFTAVSGNGIFIDSSATERLSSVVSPDDGYADTLYVGPGTGFAYTDDDPPTPSEMAALAPSLPAYRTGFDIGTRRRSGELIDRTFPGPDDNFFLNLRDILGQNPPEPLTCVEGVVKFINTESEPLKLPCLLGEDKDDSGDQQIPFLKGYPNELAVLGAVAPLLEDLYVDTGYVGLPYTPPIYDTVYGGAPATVETQEFKAVYPDERFVGDGNLVEAPGLAGTGLATYPVNPAALYTSTVLDKATQEGLPATSGLGDLRRYDLVLSQVGQAAVGFWAGATGILEVGDVVYEVPSTGGDPSGKGTIEVPRFVTPIAEGDLHRYSLRGLAARVEETEGGNEGLVIQPSTPLPSPQFETVLDFSNVSGMPDLSTLGGIINGVPIPPPVGTDRNALVIRIYDPSPTAPTAFIGAITITSGTGGFGPLSSIFFYNHSTATVTTATPIVWANFGVNQITIRYDMSLTPTPGDPVETVLGLVTGQNYDFRLDLDTYGDAETTAVTNVGIPGSLYGSTTCAIQRNRLTFTEQVDLSMAKPRDYNPANGALIGLGAALNVYEFTAGGVSGYTANAASEINGGAYLSFLNRYDTTPVFYVGTWDGTRGALRAMSWEGHGNTPLADAAYPDITGITVTGMPSSDLQEDAGGGGDYIIYAGPLAFWDGDSSTTAVDTGVNDYDLEGNRNYLLGISSPAGDLANIVHNDTCVVTGNATDENTGAIKTGTYLVRHAVPSGTGDFTAVASQMPGTPILAARQYYDPLTFTAPFPAAQAAGPGGDTVSNPTVSPPPGGTGADLVPDNGFVDLTFPEVVSADEGTAKITVSGVAPVMRDPTDPSVNHGWESTGRLYLILKDQYATYSNDAGGAGVNGWVVDADSVWSIEYTGLTYDPAEGTIVFEVDNGTQRDAYNVNPSGGFSAFMAKAVAGIKVSGMTAFGVRQMGSHFPPNNLLGADQTTAAVLMAGFEHLTIGNRNATMLNLYLDTVSPEGGGYDDDVWQSYGAGARIVHSIVGTPAAGEIVVGVPLPVDNTTFVKDKYTPLYGRMYKPFADGGTKQTPVVGVATYLRLNEWDDTHWGPVHFGVTVNLYKDDTLPFGATPPLLNCLLPSDRWVASGDSGLGPGHEPINPNGDGNWGAPGFWAYSGVFLEPSFPRPVQNLNTAIPKVVSASHATLTVDDIGARDFEPFGGATKYEPVYAVVRRVRRWHEAQVNVIDLLEPLKFVYQIRRGEVSGYTASSREFVASTTGTYAEATNLGPFNDADVNINAGDVVRILNANGDLVDTAEVQRIENATTLKLRRPGLTNEAFLSAPGDFTFEVYLEQSIVPHEQSNEQLLDLLTQEVVFTRRVTYTNAGTPDPGGFVAATNELKDSDPSVTSWAAEGVQEGDYLIVDPAGLLYKVGEYGQRPSGDMSVIDRPSPGPYIPGGPAKLDDNRGFYQITAVDEDAGGDAPGTLMVSGESRFTDGEIFGDGSQDAGYVVMPTINGSGLTEPVTPDGGVENQQDLRPTAAPVGDSFYDRPTAAWGDAGFKSIEPFGYKIIRPNSIFSQDTVELVLFIRERMLSWIDEISVLYPKSGDYWVFQRDDHIEDVGSATDTSAGLGIMSNLVVDSLKGLTDVTPFANMSDCLSVLDRRFWCLDYRLDALPTSASPTYTQFTTGGFSQRPVEPDLIDAVLNTDDLFRDQRYGWITFRSNATDGSIRNATREMRSLERRLRKQREALMRQKGLDKA